MLPGEQMLLKEYRKKGDSNAVSLVSTLLANVRLEEKKQKVEVLDDNSTISILKQLTKGIEETKKLAGDTRKDVIARCNIELNILSEFLPKMLSETEIKKEVDKYLESLTSEIDKSIFGKIMAYFKAKFIGQYDGKTLSEIVKAKLNNK